MQEVRSPKHTRVRLLTNLPASHGGIAAGLQEQKRRSRLYDRGRNPRGVSFPILRARRVGSPRPPRIGLIRDITGIALKQHSHAQMADHDVQCHDGREPPGRPAMGRPGRQRSPLPVLSNLFSPSLLGASSSRRRSAAGQRPLALQRMVYPWHAQRALGLAVASVPLLSRCKQMHDRMACMGSIVCRSTAARMAVAASMSLEPYWSS